MELTLHSTDPADLGQAIAKQVEVLCLDCPRALEFVVDTHVNSLAVAIAYTPDTREHVRMAALEALGLA